MMKLFIFIAFLAINCGVNAQYTKYRVCATKDFTTQCNILQRGNSDVTCSYVQDSVECAQQILNASMPNGAHFGLFSAESTLQLAALRWDDLVVIKESRHVDRPIDLFEFQSVVVVKDPDFRGGLDNLRNKNFCHPGLHYSRTQKWSERVLKAFERATVDPVCDIVRNASVAEIETASLSRYFNAACRSGVWSHDPEEDAYLKKTYTRLCALCDDPVNCEYSNNALWSDHRRALECLKKNGHVAYVSLSDSLNFFKENVATAPDYRYLCPNGTVTAVNTTSPCVWEKQPWPVVMTNKNKSIELKTLLTNWASGRQEWQIAVTEILTNYGNHLLVDTTIQTARNSIVNARNLPEPAQICDKSINWCTHSDDEQEKCKIARAGGITSGSYPQIECKQEATNTVINCLNEISKGNSDIMSIDSNYGFIARNNFNLTAAMYAETDDQHYSKVVVLIKANSRISKFNDLKGKKACFPEFGGIASIAFVDVGRGRGVFKQNECNYGRLLADFFGDSCAPGAKNVLHDQIFVKKSSSDADKLCKLCKNQASESRFIIEENIETFSAAQNPNARGQLMQVDEKESRPKRQINNHHCAPSSENRYFGTRGALQCLHEVGEVAVLELRKLKEFSEELKLDPQDYKIMCRNGTIVPTNNFEVDTNCPLITMIDGEVVIKRNSQKTKDVVHVLSSFDRYFNLNRNPDFKIFDAFNGKEDVLFEHSTVGLVSANSSEFGPSVLNYVRLFENTDKCVEKKNSGTLASISSIVLLLSAFISVVMH
ncbi:transferrin-like [Culicoides brevitarsis]|uniref:transferrin-like n=1 Tax=Culicoides brevitarsis TaxID=469753 RepID=UPI00307B79CE